MKKCIIGICLLLLMSSLLAAQSVQFNGFVRNSVYAYSAQKLLVPMTLNFTRVCTRPCERMRPLTS